MKLWRDIKDFFLSFYYPKGQYFLLSFPKTGRTWLMHMLNQMKDLSTHHLKDEKNFIYNQHDNSEIIIGYCSWEASQIFEEINNNCWLISELKSDILFDIDWQGTKQLSKFKNLNLIKIYLTTENKKEIKSRLIKRNQNSSQEVDKRFKSYEEVLAENYESYDSWYCTAGHQAITIFENGDVCRGRSCKKEKLGSILTGFNLFKNVERCRTKNPCTCTGDLKMPKWRDNENNLFKVG